MNLDATWLDTNELEKMKEKGQFVMEVQSLNVSNWRSRQLGKKMANQLLLLQALSEPK